MSYFQFRVGKFQENYYYYIVIKRNKISYSDKLVRKYSLDSLKPILGKWYIKILEHYVDEQ